MTQQLNEQPTAIAAGTARFDQSFLRRLDSSFEPNQIFDVVFEQKKIGFVVAGDANEARVEKLNQALHFVVVAQPDAHRNFIFDQIAQVLYLFEGLLRLEATNARPVAALAESWDISPDAKVYTFHLRSNTVWSTGERITTADVVYSWMRALSPATAADCSTSARCSARACARHSGRAASRD